MCICNNWLRSIKLICCWVTEPNGQISECCRLSNEKTHTQWRNAWAATCGQAIAFSNELCNCNDASSGYICSRHPQLFHYFLPFSSYALAPFFSSQMARAAFVPPPPPSSSSSSASATSLWCTCKKVNLFFAAAQIALCCTKVANRFSLHNPLFVYCGTDAKNEPVLRLMLGLPASSCCRGHVFSPALALLPAIAPANC